MKPKTAKDVEIVKLRTRAMMNVLMKEIGSSNPHQFGAWINRESERLGWKDTQQSNKWNKLIKGKFTKRPDKPIAMLSLLFRNAKQVYDDGPANLWRALWGDATNPATLWPLCRTRFDSDGPWFYQITWEEIEAKFLDERTFRDTIREFEGELLLAIAYDQPLTLNHLTESVALYRLHQATNRLARTDVDGVGAYRCIQLCLNDLCVSSELKSYDALSLVRDEVVEIEIGRLTTEHSYLASVGIQRHQAKLYAHDPLTWISTSNRWDALSLDWAPVDPVIAVEGGATHTERSTRHDARQARLSHASAEEVLRSAGFRGLTPGRFSAPPHVTPAASRGQVVHMHSWVEDRVERR